MIYFNPRSPHGERPCGSSTLAGWGAISTHAPRTGSDECRAFLLFLHRFYFNPRSPHGERPRGLRGFPPCPAISTHAPRTGSDATTF